MGLFHPKDLIWALLAVVIATCYFVRFARRRREVSTMMLWEQVFARRTAWRRWQRPVSLLVQLLILALLVLAYAEPYWSSVWNSARSIVVIVDNSASMNATDVETSRLWQARLSAERLIDNLGPYEQMAILSAGGLTRVHCGFSNDPATLKRALDEIRPTDGQNRVDEAVTLARRMLADQRKRNPRIMLLTDGCFDDAVQIATQAGVQTVVHAGSANNVGITRFEARPSLVARQAFDVFVEILNTGPEATTCQLEIGRPVDAEITERLELPIGEPVRRFFTYEPQQSGPLTARLDVEDHLRADNVATILLPMRQPLEIRIAGMSQASEGDEWLRRLTAAVRGNPLASVRGDAADGDFDGVTIFPIQVPQRLPPGPVLAIAPQGDCDLWAVEKVIDRAAAVAMDAGAPLLAGVTRGFSLRDLVIDGLLQVQFKQPPDAVIRAEGGDAVLSAWDRPTGRVLLLHIPLAKSDFTVRPSFPLFVANAIDWLRPRNEAFHPSVKTGDVVMAKSGNVQSTALHEPNGTVATIAAGQTMIGPLDHAGAWQLGATDNATTKGNAGTAPLVVTANLLNARETDLRPAEGLRSVTLPFGRRGRDFLWETFFLVALVLLVVEWTLRQRRILI